MESYKWEIIKNLSIIAITGLVGFYAVIFLLIKLKRA